MGLVQEETLVVFCTRMPREIVRTTWDQVERRKKISHRTSILFSTESVKTQTDVKSFFSLKASPVTRAKNSLSIAGKMKKIVM